MTEGAGLSKLVLNPLNKHARRDIASPYEMHRSVCRLFDSQARHASSLWRWEPEPDHGAVALVQSQGDPDIERMEPGWGTLEGPIRIDRHLERLTDGLLVEYRIVVNAVFIERATGKRKAVPRSQMADWWVEKAERCAGMKAAADSLAFLRDSAPIKGRGELVTARLDGIAEVCDADLLRHAILKGVGRARAFGCGLLTVKTT